MKYLKLLIIVFSVIFSCHFIHANGNKKISHPSTLPISVKLFDSVDGYFSSPFAGKFKNYIQNDGGFYLKNKSLEDSVNYPKDDYSISLYVPDNYDGGPGWGLYLFCSPNKKTNNPYKNILKKHKLIFASCNNTPNGVPYLIRMVTTLDALATVKSKYNIDPERVFIGGHSGGGTTAGFLGLVYPELFAGFLSNSSQFFLKAKEGYTYLGSILSDKDIKDIASFNSRYAFVTGDKDKNYSYVKKVPDEWKSEGLDAKLFDQPGMRHTLADSEHFDKMLTWLEEKRDKEMCDKLDTCFSKNDYIQALSLAKSVKKSSPECKEQYKKAQEILKKLEEQAGKEAQDLLKKDPENLKALMSLIRKWGNDFPGLNPAVQKCGEIGDKEAAILLAAKPYNYKVLRVFLKKWEGFDCCKKVGPEFNELGNQMLVKLNEKKSPPDKLRVFCNLWEGYACSEPVIKELAPASEKEYEKLSSNKRTTANTINRFIQKWKAFPVAPKAEALKEELADKELAEISGIKKKTSLRTKLKMFIRKYPETKAAEKAERMLE